MGSTRLIARTHRRQEPTWCARCFDSTLAGLSATVVIDRAGSVLYEHESDESREGEEHGGRDGMPTATLVKKMARAVGRDLEQDRPGKLGMVAHHAFGAADGAVSALARRAGIGPVNARLLTGLARWAVVDEGFNTAAGLAASPRSFPVAIHVRALAAHVVYGLSIGLLLAAGERDR